ncbi:hypothetical protein, partial [Algoriphagus sp.]|uniref:hypothetical protein n=1 Tax=Algoriphagus sp. TaxID=1872435 RepID=UPI00257956B0
WIELSEDTDFLQGKVSRQLACLLHPVWIVSEFITHSGPTNRGRHDTDSNRLTQQETNVSLVFALAKHEDQSFIPQ